MKLNTLRTSIMFVFTLIDGLLPVSLRRDSIASIYNLVEIRDLVRTSGQPTAKQLKSISESGVTTVLNLAPHQAENALANEQQVVENLGMQYLHLPVDFKRPTEEDFQEFSNHMKQHNRAELWVHCAANMRVSAFIYRYRLEVLGEQEAVARKDLAKIWEPFGVWRKFIARRPNSGTGRKNPE